MKPRKHNSASAEKRAEESTIDAFPLALLFFDPMIERLPSKRDDSFCLSSGKAKISCLSCNPV